MDNLEVKKIIKKNKSQWVSREKRERKNALTNGSANLLHRKT